MYEKAVGVVDRIVASSWCGNRVGIIRIEVSVGGDGDDGGRGSCHVRKYS